MTVSTHGSPHILEPGSSCWNTHTHTGEKHTLHTCWTRKCEDRMIHKHIECKKGKENICSDAICWHLFNLRGSESNSPFETDTLLTHTQPHVLKPRSGSPPPQQLSRSCWGLQGPSVVVKREGSFMRAALETKAPPRKVFIKPRGSLDPRSDCRSLASFCHWTNLCCNLHPCVCQCQYTISDTLQCNRGN